MALVIPKWEKENNKSIKLTIANNEARWKLFYQIGTSASNVGIRLYRELTFGNRYEWGISLSHMQTHVDVSATTVT